ncbi:hypothetical protein [Bradyrhizobium elkanii]|uniref:hypothetical protein n=1 Tax=Bradyrhizobium elkanii TaxID=29448 RepID=UPI000841B5E2|nr:hypothetical protein [Bradyrhizobium elkanii]ODM71729.1 hypothetical protein A6X20_07245 [Bradyrhizobium elkanii]ODM79102.1 hypothetical protein A6452_28830 [Bradyrhizobium elkanii]
MTDIKQIVSIAPIPWSTGEDRHPRRPGQVFAANGGLVADCEFPDDNEHNGQNARLIAAAPDMLLALAKTRDNLAGLSRSDDDIYAAMMQRIDSAISKAVQGK